MIGGGGGASIGGGVGAGGLSLRISVVVCGIITGILIAGTTVPHWRGGEGDGGRRWCARKEGLEEKRRRNGGVLERE